MVINVTVVGPFEEEEEGTSIASDVVKVKGEDPATPGLLLQGIDPGTVTIPQYRFNKTKQHCRYLIWVLCYIPYVGLNGVRFCDCSCSCVYCDSEFVKFVFSTLRSRSCFQLTISFVIGGREGSLL